MPFRVDIALLQQPESFPDILRSSFGDLWREIAAQTPRILAALLVLVVFVLIGLVVRRILRTTLERLTMAPRIRILILRLVFIGVLVIGGVVFLVIAFEARLGQVITGFGLLSVGIGFALKSPLENMLSGVLTILVAPFRIGDEIEVSGQAGRVETINLHDTILRTFDGKRVAIPNVDVYLNAIVNQTAFPLRRYDVLVGVHYNDDLTKAVSVAREVLDSADGVREIPEPLVLVSTLNEYSVDLILRFWSNPSMQNEFQVISDVTTNVKLAFDREGITIPFPIRTLHLPDDGEKSAGELHVRMTDGENDSRGASD